MGDDRQWHLLPGTLCTGAIFDDILDVLEVPHSSRRTVEISKPDVNDYLDYFENAVGQNDIIFGFSLGAIIAAHHADVLGENTTLLLFGINPMADDPHKAEGRAALCADVKTIGGRSALLKRLESQRIRMSASRFELILSMAENASHLIEAQTQLALSRPGALSRIEQCRCAVFTFTGEHDDQTPLNLATLVAKTAPYGRYYSLPNMMHYAILEDPAVCANAIENALRQAPHSEGRSLD